jgi:uncharacterized membrane protein
LDIADNQQNLTNNTMHLAAAMGQNTQIGYFRMVNPNTPELNVDPDQYGNADFTSFTSTVTTLTYIPVPGSKSFYTIPSTQVTVTVPAGLASGASANGSVQVAVPSNTFAGTYRGKVWVTGIPSSPGTPTDTFNLEVAVGMVDDLDIDSAMVHTTGNQGAITPSTTLFRVYSADSLNNPDRYDGYGNTTLYGVTFSVADLKDASGLKLIPAANVSFTPAMIESIPSGAFRAVTAKVFIPFGTYATTYTGLATATNASGTTSDTVRIVVLVNPYYDLDIADNEANLINNTMHLAAAMGQSTQIGNFRLVNPNSADLNVDPDQFGNANFDSLRATRTSLTYIPVPGKGTGATDISYTIPSGQVTVTLPAGLASGASGNGTVQVAVPSNTFAGTYRGTVLVTGIPGTPGTPTDQFTLEVVVGAIDDLDIDSAAVHTMGNHGAITPSTTPFNVYSTDAANNPDAYDGPGNTTLYGVTFTMQDLTAIEERGIIPHANVTFTPAMIESIPSGAFRSVTATVFVPFGTYATTYSGLATATNASGTTSDTVRIFVTVNPFWDLDIADNQANLIANKMHLSGAMGGRDSAYFRMINPNSAELNVDPDQYGNADFTSFTYATSNLHYVPIAGEKIDTMIPAGAVSFFNTVSALASGASANVGVRVVIPMNQLAGTYRGVVTVTGHAGDIVPPPPNTPADTFILEVYVGRIEDLDIDSAAVHSIGNQGTTVNTTIFRVYATDAQHNPDTYDGPGNTTLFGINFLKQDLTNTLNPARIIPATNIEIIPSTIDSIHVGTFKPCSVQVLIPYGTYTGTYTGLVTALNNTGSTSDTVRVRITVNPYYDLDISDNEQNLIANTMHLAGIISTTQHGYFRMINPNSLLLNVDPDPYGNADFTGFTAVIETLRYVPTGVEKINYIIPPSAVTLTLPSGLVNGASYDARLEVNIPTNIFNGLYRGTVSVTGTPGTPGTPTDSFTLEVTVGSFDDIDIAEAAVSANGNAGTIVNTTNFHVWSTDATHNPDPDGPGNTTLFGVTFSSTDLRAGSLVIPAANISFVPGLIESLPPGTNRTVYAVINIPFGTYATTYSGLATATNATGTTSDTVRINVTVGQRYDLDIADNLLNLVTNKMTLNLIPNTTASGEFLLVNPNSEAMNVDPDPYGNSDLTGLHYRVSEILTSPEGYTLASSVISFSNNPTSLAWGASANVTVTANIESGVHYATYSGIVTVYDMVDQATVTADSFTLAVAVGPNDAFMVSDTIYLYGYAGTFADTTFFITNTGNKTLDRVELFPMTDFYSAGGVRIPMSNIQFTPPIIIDSMRIGESTEVSVRVDIPRLTLPTTYVARAKAMQQSGNPAKNFVIVLGVLYESDISEGIIVSDNPVTGSYVDISVIGDAGTTPKLTIMNMAAEIVLTQEVELQKYGVVTTIPSCIYHWNLNNANGKPVASGMYVVIAQTKVTIDGKQQDKVFTKKILIVK